MRIKMNESQANELFEIDAIQALSVDEIKAMEPITSNGETVLEDGTNSVMYRLTNVVLQDRDKGRTIQGSLKLRNKPVKPLHKMTELRLTGSIVAVPWVNYRQNNTLTWSITADGVEDVLPTASQPTTKGRE